METINKPLNETDIKKQIARDRYAIRALTGKRSALNKQIAFLKSRQAGNEDQLYASYQPETLKTARAPEDTQLEFQWMYE